MQHVDDTLLSDVVHCVSADAGADRHFGSSITNTVSVLCGRSQARSCLGGLGLMHPVPHSSPPDLRRETEAEFCCRKVFMCPRRNFA